VRERREAQSRHPPLREEKGEKISTSFKKKRKRIGKGDMAVLGEGKKKKVDTPFLQRRERGGLCISGGGRRTLYALIQGAKKKKERVELMKARPVWRKEKDDGGMLGRRPSLSKKGRGEKGHYRISRKRKKGTISREETLSPLRGKEQGTILISFREGEAPWENRLQPPYPRGKGRIGR